MICGMISAVTEHAKHTKAEHTKAEPRKLKDKDVLNLGHLKKVFKLLDRLHEVGCARDKAGNRELHYDQ